MTTTSRPLSTTDFSVHEFDNQWSDVNHPHFYFDPGFKQFCLKKLDDLEELAVGWDCAGAPPLNRKVTAAVRRFIIALPEHIAIRPNIVPLSSGNVQLEWDHGRTGLELEFESPTEVHYLKWDPRHQIEEEDTISISRSGDLVGLIRWFMKEMLNAG